MAQMEIDWLIPLRLPKGCTRLGNDRATSHVSMIVFAISFPGDFLVVSQGLLKALSSVIAPEAKLERLHCLTVQHERGMVMLATQSENRIHVLLTHVVCFACDHVLRVSATDAGRRVISGRRFHS